MGFTNQYLKRIKYGNKTPYQSDFLFEVVFDYGERDYDIDDAHVNGQKRPWDCRPDTFSSYRAGFEIRTYRLCRRVMVFHRFEELGKNPCLVRSTDFNHAFNTISCYSYLTSATQTGYVWDRDHYRTRSLPPVEFTYSVAAIQDRVEIADTASLENLPQGIDGRTYQWIDLDGEEREFRGFGMVEQEDAESFEDFYERNPADPRIGHNIVLEVDAFGNVLKSVAVGYGRRKVIFDVDEQGKIRRIPNPDLAELAEKDRETQTYGSNHLHRIRLHQGHRF